MSRLFRAEALAANETRQFGSPSGFHPLAWTVLTALLVSILAAAAIFLTTQSYARKETVRGVLRAETGEVRAFAHRGGTVRRLLVREGDVVAAGAVLAIVSTAQRTETYANADEAVLAAIRSEERALRARRRAAAAAAPLDREAIAARIAALDEERRAALSGAASSRERLDLAMGRLAAGETLVAKGLIPAEEMQRRRELVIALRQAGADQEAIAANRAAQMAENRARLRRAVHDAAQAQADIDQALAALAQRRTQAEAGKGYAIIAATAGRVTALQASVGQSIDPQRPLMTITPVDASLVADLFVPSRAIGFIERGRPVRLLFEAFPYQRFGPSFGRVTSISATVLTPGEINAAAPIQEPVYRVVAALDRQTLYAFGREHTLVSGMALTADVVLEERSFADWLLEPLYAVRRRAEGPGR